MTSRSLILQRECRNCARVAAGSDGDAEAHRRFYGSSFQRDLRGDYAGIDIVRFTEKFADIVGVRFVIRLCSYR